jgi:hypothetical protein
MLFSTREHKSQSLFSHPRLLSNPEPLNSTGLSIQLNLSSSHPPHPRPASSCPAKTKLYNQTKTSSNHRFNFHNSGYGDVRVENGCKVHASLRREIYFDRGSGMLLVKGEVRLVGGEKRRGRVLCLRKFWAELDWGNGEGWTRSERKEQGGKGEDFFWFFSVQ